METLNDGGGNCEAESTRLDSPGGGTSAVDCCGICFADDGEFERGVLDTCSHLFCFPCIMSWSKVESRCPMCKQRFLRIERQGGGKTRPRSFRIPLVNQTYEPTEEETERALQSHTCCMECSLGSDAGRLIVCHRCDRPAHVFCVGLTDAPLVEWFCTPCKAARECEYGDSAEDVSWHDESDEEENYSGDEDDLLPVASLSSQRVPQRRNLRRMLTRTASVQAGSGWGREPQRRLTTRPRTRQRVAATQGLQAVLLSSNQAPRRSGNMLRQSARQQRVQEMRNNWQQLRAEVVPFSGASSRLGTSSPPPPVLPSPPVLPTPPTAATPEIELAWRRLNEAQALSSIAENESSSQARATSEQGLPSSLAKKPRLERRQAIPFVPLDWGEVRPIGRHAQIGSSTLVPQVSNSESSIIPLVTDSLPAIHQQSGVDSIQGNPSDPESKGLSEKMSASRATSSQGASQRESDKAEAATAVKKWLAPMHRAHTLSTDEFRSVARAATHSLLAASATPCHLSASDCDHAQAATWRHQCVMCHAYRALDTIRRRISHSYHSRLGTQGRMLL